MSALVQQPWGFLLRKNITWTAANVLTVMSSGSSHRSMNRSVLAANCLNYGVCCTIFDDLKLPTKQVGLAKKYSN